MPRILPINLDDLLHARSVESPRIEFKGSWNTGPVGLQVLRTICAFANDFQNLNGGYIVLGVGERDGTAELPPVGLDPTKLDAIQKWIRGRCKTIDPEVQPVPSPEVVDGRHILVIWVPASDARPHSVARSASKGAERVPFVRLGSETVEAQGEVKRQLMQLTAKIPFDDRRAQDAPVERIRETRVREFLTQVGSDLVEEADARVIYRRMRLVARANGHEAPLNVALLFFADDPEDWFRGARIEVARLPGDSGGDVIEERIFKGPLEHHLRDAIAHLRNHLGRHLEKQPDRAEVASRVDYPLAALEEALVNAVYHRSYEATPDPVEVRLYPERIEVISHPGPVPGIDPSHFAAGARVPPVPARNRRIGEFLKELRLAEARLTGIDKIRRAMRQNGSPEPEFDFDAGRTFFRVTLRAHPQHVLIAALRDAAELRARGEVREALERLHQAAGFFESKHAASWATPRDVLTLVDTMFETLGSGGPRIPGYLSLREPALQRIRTLLEQALGMESDDESRAWVWFRIAKLRRWLHAPAAEQRQALEEALRLLPGEPRFREELGRIE